MKLSLGRLFFTFAISTLSAGSFASAAEPAFTPKPDTLWVMAGDSITAQRLHTNYIEAFYRTRYPNLHLQFRNSGIGGNRTGDIIHRFDYDVAAWKPTVVSIELGMNDVNGGDDPAGYVKGLKELVEKIHAAKAEAILISSSPVNDGWMPTENKADRNHRLDLYTDAMKTLAGEENVVFVDQFHPLLDLWGKNYQKQAAIDATQPAPSPDPTAKPAPGKAPAKKSNTGFIQLHGDAVHTGPVGQYTMAATILNALNVDHDVSSATLKADGAVVESKHCKISEATAKAGKISFDRLDESSPWPIDPKSKEVLKLLPTIADLSRYTLTISDLPPGNYAVSINGKPAATVSEKELAAGWNMSTVFEGTMAERSTKIMDLINTLEGKLNSEWRDASKKKDADKLAAAEKAIDAVEAELKTACEPATLKFEIDNAK